MTFSTWQTGAVGPVLSAVLVFIATFTGLYPKSEGWAEYQGFMIFLGFAFGFMIILDYRMGKLSGRDIRQFFATFLVFTTLGAMLFEYPAPFTRWIGGAYIFAMVGAAASLAALLAILLTRKWRVTVEPYESDVREAAQK